MEDNVYNVKDSVCSFEVNVYNAKDNVCNLNDNVCSMEDNVYAMKDNVCSVEVNVYNAEDTDCNVEGNCGMEDNGYNVKNNVCIMEDNLYNIKDSVCNLEDDVYNVKNNVYNVKDNICNLEDKVNHVIDNVCGIEVNLYNAEDTACNNVEDNVCSTEDKVRSTEVNFCSTKGNVCSTEDNFCSTEDNVCRMEDNVNSLEDKDPGPVPHQCPMCPTSFIARKNMYVHLRRRHGVEPNTGGKILCPLLCGSAFYRHKDLRTHLESKHATVIHSEDHDFTDSTTFEAWKRGLEQSSGQSWVRRISEKNLKRGEAKTYFICHRSGVHRPKESSCTRKRPETLKIGTTCPSVMEVSRFPDGSIKVVFYNTHVGHSMESPRTPRRKPKNTARTIIKKSEMLPWDVCAVLPAAGIGERLGGDTPKQYLPLHHKPIICYTVEAFLKLSYIKKVVVVAASDSLNSMLHTLGEMCALEGDKLMVTEGASSRHESIRSGLRALQTCCEFQPGVVVVHDGVRPFVSEDIISGVIHAAKTYGAAGVTCPLVSTVVSVDADGFLDTSLDRNQFRASEMPQAFNYDLICKAYDMASAYDLEYGTECLHLMQKYLHIKAKLLPGNSNLWKVTHRKDIYTAASVVKENQSVGIISSSSWSSLALILEKCLSRTFQSVQSAGCKLRDMSLRKYPNLVQICEECDPYPLLERLSGLATSQQHLTQRTSLAHIFVNTFDATLNFLEFQRQAKMCAKLLKGANLLVYFVIYTGATETIEELGELVRSLLFDSNPNISGSVFLS